MDSRMALISKALDCERKCDKPQTSQELSTRTSANFSTSNAPGSPFIPPHDVLHETNATSTYCTNHSLSKRTDFEGPASGGVLEVEGPTSGWTAIVRAMSVFCFLRLRPKDSSVDCDSFGRFWAMGKRIEFECSLIVDRSA